MRRIPFFLTDDKLKILIQNADNKMRMMILMSAFMGLRVSEVVGARIEDIDFPDNVFKVRRENAKLAKERIVPMPSFLSKAFSYYLSKYHPNESQGWIFPSRKDKTRHLLPDTVRAEFKDLTKISGLFDSYALSVDGRKLSKIHFHSLRHFYCNAIYTKTHDLNAVKELAGHATILSSQVYVHADTAYKKDVVHFVFDPKIITDAD